MEITPDGCPELIRCSSSLDGLAAGLLKPVLPERADTAEELVICLAVLLRSVLDRCQLDGAEIVRHLLQPVVRHRGLAALDDALRENETYRLVERLLHDVLTVVVIDLHLVEPLEELQMVEQEVRDVALHAGGELSGVFELVPAVDESLVGDGKALRQDVERVQHLLAGLQADPLVRPVAVQQGLGVERYVRQVGIQEGLLVPGDLVGDASDWSWITSVRR